VARKMRDIMSSAPVCMAASEPVSAAATAMRDHGIGTVLVVSGGKLSGLVTDRDIAVPIVQDGIPVGIISVGDLAREAGQPSAPPDV
jgi:CBS domain-containing protein